MVSQRMNKWCGRVASVLLGGFVLTLLLTADGRPADDKAKPAALPTDLAKMPSDGFCVECIRVADLWQSDMLKAVRGQHKEVEQGIQESVKRFGLPLAQIERLTIAIVGPPPESRDFIYFVHTIKPYDLAKVLAAGPKLKEEKYKGETLYVGDKWAVYPLDKQSLVYTDTPKELHHLIDHPRPKERGALADALDLASQKHALVAGVNIKQLYDATDGNILPREAEPFRPLFIAHWGLLVADIGAESRVTGTLHFANEKDAKAGDPAAGAFLDFMRGSVDQGIGALGKDKDMVEVVAQLKQLVKPLKETQVERKGAALQVTVRAKIDSAGLGVVLAKAVGRMREAAIRSESANNLLNIALAMHDYHATYAHFPAQAIFDKNGKPLLSWRVTILPFVGQQELYKQFHLDEPWDSEHNKKLLAKMPKTYAIPGDEKSPQEHTTYYQGFVGEGAIFEGKKGLRFADVPDGLSNTIMVVEASKAVPWTKPEDIPFDPAKPLPKLGRPGASVIMAGLCDGSVKALSPKMKPETLRNAIMRNDGNPLGDDF